MVQPIRRQRRNYDMDAVILTDTQREKLTAIIVRQTPSWKDSIKVIPDARLLILARHIFLVTLLPEEIEFVRDEIIPLLHEE